MKRHLIPSIVIAGLFCTLNGQNSESALTIYNQDFAVVRHTITLDLSNGINHIRFHDTTAHLEPDSVILRDPKGEWHLQILEQNYRADPISQELLLSLYEGETIEFLVYRGDEVEVLGGKIVRSGYVPHQVGLARYGSQYYANQMARAGGGSGQPIIEIDGRLRFSLPGIPLFPRLTDDTIMKPTLDWQIASDRSGDLEAELGYVTGGMSWEASYNIVTPEDSDLMDLVGWVTIDNQSGKAFPNAKIKLMAGDVARLSPEQLQSFAPKAIAFEMDEARAGVEEKTFDEYHLYSIRRPTTLHDRETKQVEFVRAGGFHSERLYVYDGAQVNLSRYRGYDPTHLRQDSNFGVQFNPKVVVMHEFVNSKENHLGMPLPRGRVRFYRQDTDGQLEFTGENLIDHTPEDETIRLVTGSAFDLVGERIRTDFRVDSRGHWVEEAFEIKLRNHKDVPVEIRVVEHLYRWNNWNILQSSTEHRKVDSQTIEFRVQVSADGESTLSYRVHYSW